MGADLVRRLGTVGICPHKKRIRAKEVTKKQTETFKESGRLVRICTVL